MNLLSAVTSAEPEIKCKGSGDVSPVATLRQFRTSDLHSGTKVRNVQILDKVYLMPEGSHATISLLLSLGVLQERLNASRYC